MPNHTYSLGRDIMILDKLFRLYMKRSLKQYNLNTAEGMCLLVLLEKAYVTQDQLIEELQYDKGVVARTMKDLVEKGYMMRDDNPLDRRSYIYSLQPKAIQFKETLINILIAWNDFVQDGILEDDLKDSHQTLQKMLANATSKDFVYIDQ